MSTHAGAGAPCSRSTRPGISGPRPCRRHPRLGPRGTRVSRRNRRDRGHEHRLRAEGGRRCDRGPGRPVAVRRRQHLRQRTRASSSRRHRASSRPATSTASILHSGGSEAVEVALKLARQYHVERGEPARDTFVSRWIEYHGATLGGALGRRERQARRKVYEPLLLQTPHVRARTIPLPVAGWHTGMRRGGRGRDRGGDPGRRPRPGRRVHRGADRRQRRWRDPAPGRLLPLRPRDLRPPRRAADPR